MNTSSLPAEAGLDDASSASSISTRFVLLTIALWSLAAGGIHFAVIHEHLSEYRPFGYFFIVLATFQVVWSVAVVSEQGRADRRLIALGVGANLVTVVLWLAARTTGLPVGPERWTPEPFGFADTLSAVLEFGLAVAGGALLASVRVPIRRLGLSIVVVGLVTFGVTAAALNDLSGDESMDMPM